MGRLVGIGVLVLGIAGICVIIATCVAFDIAARSNLFSFDSSRSIAHVGDTPANATPEELGERLFERNCSGCHSIDGTDKTGPTMQGLSGSSVEMDDGRTLTVDEEHIRIAITDPRRTTRSGFRDVMPAFDSISDQDLNALIAYIRSLEN